MKIQFSRYAYQELLDSMEYYELQLEGLGTRFMEAVDLGIKRIKENPKAWEKYSRFTRKHSLGKFPYKLIYEIDGDTITIIAVAHSHRRPSYWVDESKDI
jgi:mRNA-degrading endonuclease RelE of RelBE toxin-antitoxin system